MRIAIVVLHYENLKDTSECLESLKKYLKDGQNQTDVIVVDNGSVKEKALELEKKFQNPKVHFIYSETNQGFARGNNLGFQYAKHRLHAEIIILANNDLVFKQADFLERVSREVVKNQIDVAGPKIISIVDKKNQNPVPYFHPDILAVKKRILKLEILEFLCTFGLDLFAQTIFSKEHNVDSEKDTYQLHGACLIMANNYIKNYEGLYPDTFMYMEEDILKYITQRDGLNMQYLDDIEVFHKEGSSTEKIYGAGRKKRLFYYRWNIDSCKKLKHLMESEYMNAINK